MHRLNTGNWLGLQLVVVALVLLPYAFAQETTAGLQGILKDPSGAVIAHATVEVTSPALIGNKKVETDQRGYFRFANLPPGTYTVTAIFRWTCLPLAASEP